MNSLLKSALLFSSAALFLAQAGDLEAGQLVQSVVAGTAGQPGSITPSVEELSRTSTLAEKKPAVVEVESLSVKPYGFLPDEVKRTKGPFYLFVKNRSGFLDLHLRLQKETGEHLKDIEPTARNPKWVGLLDLPPGSYVVEAVERPDWKCRISITAE